MKKIALGFVVALSLTYAGSSRAELDPTDCPPGSASKMEGDMTWCEPSVCENDGNCLPNEVCRPMALCVQIGTVAGDAGATATNKASRLIATGRCAADKKCQSTTTCSEKSRCIDKQKADKLGILTPPAAAPSSGSAPEPYTKKSSCGCSVVGARGDLSGRDAALGAALGLSALGLAVTRRRARRAR